MGKREAKIEADILMETYKAKTFFIKKERPEWMNISRFTAGLLMRESWKMFGNLFLSLSLGVEQRKNLFVLLWNDQFNKPFHSLSLESFFIFYYLPPPSLPSHPVE